MSDLLGDRMREYENAYRHYLPKRLPILLRLDGCHFHTLTKYLGKPWDIPFSEAMWATTTTLCDTLATCKLGFQQSDEITLLLINYTKLNTEPLYNNGLQKLVSTTAALASARFNELIHQVYPRLPLATFDCRAWILPKEEVNNAFVWRQQDARRNSVNALAQHHFSSHDLQGLHVDACITKLREVGVDYDKLPTWQQRGMCVVTEKYTRNGVTRQRWIHDLEIPIFSQDHDYVDRYVRLGDEVDE